MRTDATGGKRVIAMPGERFISRLLQHVLPSGFKRIRHYGLLAPATKTERLALARGPLTMPPANLRAAEDARDSMRRVPGIDIATCPHCRIGPWLVVEQLEPQRPADGPVPLWPMPQRGPQSRGPP